LARKLEEIFTMVGHFENTISYWQRVWYCAWAWAIVILMKSVIALKILHHTTVLRVWAYFPVHLLNVIRPYFKSQYFSHGCQPPTQPPTIFDNIHWENLVSTCTQMNHAMHLLIHFWNAFALMARKAWWRGRESFSLVENDKSL
jgi:hypothetical protein